MTGGVLQKWGRAGGRAHASKLAVEAAMDTYDALVFPGFLRQPPAKWQDDGSCAPSGRARGKADQFALSLPRPSIEADIAAIEHESSNGQRAKRRGSKS